MSGLPHGGAAQEHGLWYEACNGNSNATVAAVIERDGQFLLVEEHTEDGVRLNQPAGHWEHGESLLDAVRRETLEENRLRV